MKKAKKKPAASAAAHADWPLQRPATQWNDAGDALAAEPLAAECTIDDFAKVDLRVARVVAAEEVPEARKLLKLTLSLGGGVTKQVFAGIKAPTSRSNSSAGWSCASPISPRGR